MSEEYYMHTEPMLEMFFFETNQLLEEFEDILISLKDTNKLTEDCINEIFRIMHTIKGSSSMMMFEEISGVTHSLEDIFFHIRENAISQTDCQNKCDIGFMTMDFINGELSSQSEMLKDMVSKFTLKDKGDSFRMKEKATKKPKLKGYIRKAEDVVISLDDRDFSKY